MATKDKDLELQKETQQSSGSVALRTYQPSEAVKSAQAKLQSQLTTKPGAYQSPWQTQLDDTMKKILNREKFNYDLNGDALWQQYKDRYVQQGKMAMMDTMGQASALTGGYGNSYAQQVGQQTYQQYLTGLTDKIPELYQLALDKYRMEGDDLYTQYGILGDRENQDYGRYRDGVADWNTEYNRLYGEFADERGFDYGQHADQMAQDRWQAEFDENKRRYDQEWAAAHPELVGGAGDLDSPNGPSGPGNGNKWDNGGLTDAQIREMQEYYGVDPDGKWWNRYGVDANDAYADYIHWKANQGHPDVVGAEEFNPLVGRLNTYKQNGATNEEIRTYLRNQKNAGVITSAVYDSLIQDYPVKGNTR